MPEPVNREETAADVALELFVCPAGAPVAVHQLAALCGAYERYGRVLKEDEWRNIMLRAVVVEMRVAVEQLWADCQDP